MIFHMTITALLMVWTESAARTGGQDANPSAYVTQAGIGEMWKLLSDDVQLKCVKTSKENIPK